ncbi:MAG: large conductance mechanosensitive channel protein MscL [Mogibacterium sp.]|nr:large conductance mechanosensitive channel protein MscL [Mogibacterium sp.]
MKAFMKEFKEFISKGNVMDMAVGIIIGGAFTAIVNSLVESIITPLLGVIFGGISFAEMGVTVGDSTILFGAFIDAVIKFLLISFVLFSIIKALNKAKSLAVKEKEQAEEEPAADPEDIALLKEIRDLLKENK